MAADALTYYKRAVGSGETENVVQIGADNNVNTTKTQQPFVFELRFKKDIYDDLHADTKTALDALTISALIAKAYGAS